jgi:hypothetical protein
VALDNETGLTFKKRARKSNTRLLHHVISTHCAFCNTGQVIMWWQKYLTFPGRLRKLRREFGI